MSSFRATASPANYGSHSNGGHAVSCFRKRGEAGREHSSPILLVSIHKPRDSCLAAICAHSEIQGPHADLTQGIRSTWIYILYSLRVMNLTLLGLLDFVHLLTLLYETLQPFLRMAEAELFESGKLFSYQISSKSTDAFNSQFYHRNKSV